jgi:hypothetical protein
MKNFIAIVIAFSVTCIAVAQESKVATAPKDDMLSPLYCGYWNPRVGYGFADPRNHGVACY